MFISRVQKIHVRNTDDESMRNSNHFLFSTYKNMNNIEGKKEKNFSVKL